MDNKSRFEESESAKDERLDKLKTNGARCENCTNRSNACNHSTKNPCIFYRGGYDV